MHHHLALLINITVALFTAFTGGYLARQLGLPSLTPGFVGEIEDISQLAEMGVIFMLFGVGLHFSLQDLWRVRRIAIPGAILQMLLATALGVLLTQLWGWPIGASLVLGLSTNPIEGIYDA